MKLLDYLHEADIYEYSISNIHPDTYPVCEFSIDGINIIISLQDNTREFYDDMIKKETIKHLEFELDYCKLRVKTLEDSITAVTKLKL